MSKVGIRKFSLPNALRDVQITEIKDFAGSFLFTRKVNPFEAIAGKPDICVYLSLSRSEKRKFGNQIRTWTAKMNNGAFTYTNLFNECIDLDKSHEYNFSVEDKNGAQFITIRSIKLYISSNNGL